MRTFDPKEGPFDARPRGRVPSNDHFTAMESRWAQAPDGKWYAFYSNVGPGQSYDVQHPTDPQWWCDDPTADPEDHSLWACRHGYFAREADDDDEDAICGLPHPPGPIEFIPPTDEEVEAAATAAQALLASLQTK